MKTATIGFFDGVHKGHQHLIRQVTDEAHRRGTQSLVITFRDHPRNVLSQMAGKASSLQLLTTADEKTELICREGVDEVVLLDFTPEMSMMTARQFMQTVLKEQMGVGALIIGYDHRFGHNREEGFEDYVKIGHELGIDVKSASAFEENHITVSSSLIRQNLLQGRVDDAEVLLGRPYQISGTVVGGFQVGRKIGYPTANINVSKEKLLPCDGVYAVIAKVDGKEFGGMLNIGCRPTFDNGKRSIEVNLFDFSADIYSEQISIQFISYLRSEKRFENADQLILQLASDESEARRILSNTSPRVINH